MDKKAGDRKNDQAKNRGKHFSGAKIGNSQRSEHNGTNGLRDNQLTTSKIETMEKDQRTIKSTMGKTTEDRNNAQAENYGKHFCRARNGKATPMMAEKLWKIGVEEWPQLGTEECIYGSGELTGKE